MKAQEIRQSFLRFFQERGHRVVPSSSLVPTGDPTLFFTNAGMNQFKDVFTGRAEAGTPRAASVQKCMRVSGKHNDFETVGRSLRHHTFFEMLGNFSFGDYFKREAIAWAWELVVGTWGLDADRLVATVHESDDEAEAIWRRDIGLAADRVLRLGDEENYWSMGEVGPNGPCSELHHDAGPGVGCGRPDCGPACSCDRFSEIWNLVFMQFERTPDGQSRALPRPSIDTGMGLERVATVLQGCRSNYDTDLFAPVMAWLARRSGVPHRRVELGGEQAAERDEQQVSLRVIADHVRALSFLVADGVVPTNEGRGYVLRKLLRRAAGHGRRIGLPAPFLAELSGVVVDHLGDAYPELRREAAAIRGTLEREEVSFETTLAQGTGQLGDLLGRLRAEGLDRVPGDDAFRLHDTYGFPLEYTVEIAREAGFNVDREGFERALEQQRSRARAAARSTAPAAEALPSDLALEQTEFRGHDELVTEGCRVLALAADGAALDRLPAGQEGWVVLDRTPFYAESGGQVGDSGVLGGPAGPRASVGDTQALRPGVTGHRVRVDEGALAVGDELVATVDAARRRRIMANHTATHLLHRALKEVLGPQARQAGSLVAPDRLRFDFTWSQPLTDEQLARVEQLVNEQVFAHRPVSRRVMGHQEALAAGAVAMFGEKYGDVVRVVAVDDWSVELCGGTHCDRTEQVGALRIVAERGVAAGIRRIEAVTGAGVHERLVEDERLLEELERALKAPRAELPVAVERLADQVRGLRRELDEARRKAATGVAAEGRRAEVEGLRLEARELPGLDMGALREIAEGTRQQAGLDALLLGSEKGGKAALVLALSPAAAARLGGEAARDVVGELAQRLGGGGGGRADFAWAGGRQAERLAEALEALPEVVRTRLAGREGGPA